MLETAIAVILIIIGFGLTFGFGWFGFVLDILGALSGHSSSPSDYKEMQKLFNNTKAKAIGLVFIVVGAMLILY